jgi:hypothetical protein
MATLRYSRIDPPEMSQSEPDYFNRVTRFSNAIPNPSSNTATSPDYDTQRQSATSLLSGTTQDPDASASPKASLPPYLDYSESPIAGLDGSGTYNSWNSGWMSD